MITKEQMNEAKNKCFICKSSELTNENPYIYEISKQKKPSYHSQYKDAIYVKIVENLYSEIFFCEDCWKSVAGPDYELEGK